MTTIDSMMIFIGATETMAPDAKVKAQREFLQGLFDNFKVQIEGKDKEIVGKDQLATALTQARDELQRDKIDLKQDLAVAEGKRLKLDSEFRALTHMRPLIECCIGVLWPNIPTATARVQELQKLMFVNGNYLNGALTPEARDYMKILGGEVPNSSINDLRMLYDHLSRDHHVLYTSVSGFICGGDLPLRLAVGVAIASVQKELVTRNLINKADFIVNYCDTLGNVTNLIQGGKVTPITII
jgi:hypothetical protein